MRILIAEDDFISRKVMLKILSEYGECDVATDGQEAVNAFDLAWEASAPYDVLFLDIMMPNMDGHGVLKYIRTQERKREVPFARELKIIMTSALDDAKTVVQSFYQGGATSYLVKPIERRRVIEELRNMGLL